MLNKIIFNLDTYQIESQDIPQILNVGQDNSVEFAFYFKQGGVFVSNPLWQVYVVFVRADDEKSNLTLTNLNGDHYVKGIGSWFTDVEGIGKVQVHVKFDTYEPVKAFATFSIPINEGFAPSGDTITDEQYQELLINLNKKFDKTGGTITGDVIVEGDINAQQVHADIWTNKIQSDGGFIGMEADAIDIKTFDDLNLDSGGSLDLHTVSGASVRLGGDAIIGSETGIAAMESKDNAVELDGDSFKFFKDTAIDNVKNSDSVKGLVNKGYVDAIKDTADNNKLDINNIKLNYALKSYVVDLINTHNNDPESHQYLINLIANIEVGNSEALVFNTTQEVIDWVEAQNVPYILSNGKELLPSGLIIGQKIFTIDKIDEDYWVKETPVLTMDDLIGVHGDIDLSAYAKLTDLTAMETTIKAWVDSNYVIKENGKSLITDAEKNKLAGIEAGAEVNKVDSVNGKVGNVVIDKTQLGLENVDNTSDLDKPLSTAVINALLDKVSITTFDNQLLEKLNIRPNGTDLLIIGGKVNAVYIDSSQQGSSHPIVDSEAEMLALNVDVGTVVIRSDKNNELYILKATPANELSNWAIVSPNTVVSVAGKTGIVLLGISDIDGLTQALNLKVNATTFESEITRLEGLIDNKVDKVSGKGLSTNDFTNVLKDKLDGINDADIVKLNDIEQVYGGKNIGPDLTGKEYLGNGVYRLGSNAGVTFDYNVYNGHFVLNGTPATETISFLNTFNIQPMQGTFSLNVISGSSNLGEIFWNGEHPSQYLLENIVNGNRVKNDVSITSLMYFITFSDYTRTPYNNYTFTMQLEKGTVATPYTLPLWITPEYLDAKGSWTTILDKISFTGNSYQNSYRLINGKTYYIEGMNLSSQSYTEGTLTFTYFTGITNYLYLYDSEEDRIEVFAVYTDGASFTIGNILVDANMTFTLKIQN